MSIYCKNCGVENLQESKFCSGCGSSLTTAVSKKASKFKKFFSIFLNALYPGIGYFYAGNVKKALWFMPLFTITLYLVLFISYFVPTSVSYLTSYGVIAALYFYGLIDVYRYFSKTNPETKKWYLIILFIIVSGVFSLMIHMLSPISLFKQTSTSMENSIKIGDQIIVLLNHSYEISRGDIVIFRYPNNQQMHYVKRCVALPGDELFVEDKILYLHPREGNEYVAKAFPGYELINVDGKIWVKDPYIKEHPGIHHDNHIVQDGLMPMEIFNFAPIQVPEKQYFMMGDNRDHSNDSRFLGTVSYEDIEGRVTNIFVNWNELARAGIKIK